MKLSYLLKYIFCILIDNFTKSLVISIRPDYSMIQNSLDITLCYVCQFAGIILPYFHMSYINL